MNVPHHIAIIPDGNRRWARDRNLPIFEGHRKGAERLKELAETAKELDIKVATFWAFSTENWERTKEEVVMLMSLFERVFQKYSQKLIENKIHFTHLGRKDRLPKRLLTLIHETEEKTNQFRDHYFALALDYGGRDEVMRATQQMSNINKKELDQFLDTKDLPYPYPDLVIRTGGEQRTSGFMIWQAAYSEWIFYPAYFPDFTPADLKKCIEVYIERKRRFGK